MKLYKLFALLLIVPLICSCTSSYKNKNAENYTISTRFTPPKNAERIETTDPFALFLRSVPLKEDNAKVKSFDGKILKTNFYDAVIDYDISAYDRQQCADAIMRLRGEYLFSIGEFDKINFHFVSGFLAEYSKWIEGYRIEVNHETNEVTWIQSSPPGNTYADFRSFMEVVFTYASTLSLDKELQSVSTDEMQIGDVFVRPGSPGHAVIVVDMAQDLSNGTKYFMIAQSSMPAQDIHILKNTKTKSLSPWYKSNFGDSLVIPGFDFDKNMLKRFP